MMLLVVKPEVCPEVSPDKKPVGFILVKKKLCGGKLYKYGDNLHEWTAVMFFER